MEFKFTGIPISFITFTAANRGMCDIYIDGTLEESVDAYSPTLRARKVLFTKGGLVNGEHTIKIVVIGEKNASATNNIMTIDAFEVYR